VAKEIATPEERIDASYQELRQALTADLRDRISAISPVAFEDLVLDVLHAMGYGDGTEDSPTAHGRQRRTGKPIPRSRKLLARLSAVSAPT
jgi:restriction endonuclease Mrr